MRNRAFAKCFSALFIFSLLAISGCSVGYLVNFSSIRYIPGIAKKYDHKATVDKLARVARDLYGKIDPYRVDMVYDDQRWMDYLRDNLEHSPANVLGFWDPTTRTVTVRMKHVKWTRTAAHEILHAHGFRHGPFRGSDQYIEFEMEVDRLLEEAGYKVDIYEEEFFNLLYAAQEG